MVSHLKEKIPNMFTMRCICHTAHLCVSRVGTKPGLWTLDWTMDWTMDWIMDWIMDSILDLILDQTALL